MVQKFGPLSENSSPLLVSQANYGPGFKYLLITVFRLNAMVCSILGYGIFDAGHIKCSRRPHLVLGPHRCSNPRIDIYLL